MKDSKQGAQHRDWKVRQHHVNPTLGIHHRSKQGYQTDIAFTKLPMFTTTTQLRRIVLGNQPRLLREMLGHVFAATPGLQVVAEVEDPRQLPAVLSQAEAHWLIVTLDSENWDSAPWSMLPMAGNSRADDQAPSISLMAISPDGRQVEIQTSTAEEGRHSYTLYDISLAHLLTLLS